MSINIGLQDNQRKDIVAGLSKALANTHALYLKTHGYHWNVTGMQFQSLHTLFEEQYQKLFEALDDIAERIRSLGELAPASTGAMVKLADLPDDDDAPKAETMIANLVRDHETMARSLRELSANASEAGDEATADLVNARLDEHEKTAWMLRSHLE